MTSNRPYLLRALFDWICDNGATPYLLVDATVPDVQVPREHVEDGKILLNISPSAVRSLLIGDEELSFDARFSGREMALVMPIDSIRAIFARETQEGMTFPPIESARDNVGNGETGKNGDERSSDVISTESDATKDSSQPTLKTVDTSHLKVIK